MSVYTSTSTYSSTSTVFRKTVDVDVYVDDGALAARAPANYHAPMKFHSLLIALLCITSVFADGPGDNLPDKVRPIPPAGIEVPAEKKQQLQAGLKKLQDTIDALRRQHAKNADLLALLPDIEIYEKAVRYALQYNEIFKPNEIDAAAKLLEQGLERAAAMKEGNTPWATATGLIARGYRSKIDGSVQPYGIYVPDSFRGKDDAARRLDLWCHGRGETLSELNFITSVQRSPGQFVAPDTFVLQLYGRYSNAYKFAGEIDMLEALDHARANYNIDERRVLIRGFSMGGAAAWQFAVHYPGLFAAAAPGAGFSETREFLGGFQNEDVSGARWYQQKLWRMYDATEYAVNLYNLPTVAYSGEIDRQKQAADIMAKYLAAEGLTLTHIIGPNTAHKYEPGAKQEIIRRIDSIAAVGRDICPPAVKFTTFTLRYNRSHWVVIDALEEHWERGRVDAQITAPGSIELFTSGITALTLDMPAGTCPLDRINPPVITIDSQQLSGPPVQTDRSWRVHLSRRGARWSVVDAPPGGMVKRHGLQGPIDDAFMDSFIIVRPTGMALNEQIGKWTAAEQAHAIEHWRRHFRGAPRIVEDIAVTDEQIASANLVLFGDPSSNKVLARIAGKLPIQWSAKGIVARGKTYDPAHHMLLMIYPNPLNPDRYVVLNSGFTYREYDYLNNARQTPKLPDWAIIDTRSPITSQTPGKVVDAGFFDEQWQMK